MALGSSDPHSRTPPKPLLEGLLLQREVPPSAAVSVLAHAASAKGPLGPSGLLPPLGPGTNRSPVSSGVPPGRAVYYWGPQWPGPELCPRFGVSPSTSASLSPQGALVAPGLWQTWATTPTPSPSLWGLPTCTGPQVLLPRQHKVDSGFFVSLQSTSGSGSYNHTKLNHTAFLCGILLNSY